MRYYAIQVRTADEDEFIKRALLALPEEGARFFAPKRALNQRKAGKVAKKLLSVFPGYVFLETEELDLPLRWKLRRVSGFYRFLKDNKDPRPLNEKDRQILLRFISFGKFADTSKVSFDENQRIVVLDGPLKGLEGSIVKVDRRRGRAKVKLDICETGFLIDLGFETVAKADKGEGGSNGGT